MKKIITSIIVLVVAGLFLYFFIDKAPTLKTPPLSTEDSIVGCYVARITKDVYTMHIESQNGENISGTLDFDNFEKDSSSGSFVGTYRDGILLGDYSFQSEGMYSVMQVIFKKSGDDFIRGYGDLNAEGNRFTNPSTVIYDPSSALSLFKKEDCATITSKILFETMLESSL
jgi:hypothetical protein